MKRRYKRARRNRIIKAMTSSFKVFWEKKQVFWEARSRKSKKKLVYVLCSSRFPYFPRKPPPVVAWRPRERVQAKSQSPRFLLGLKPCSLPRPRRPLRGANENSISPFPEADRRFSPPLRHSSRRLRLVCTSTASPVGPSSTGGIYRTTLGIFPRTFASTLLLRNLIARRWKSFDFDERKKKNITRTTRRKSRRRRKTKSD